MENEISIYDRIGGKPTLDKLVGAFYVNVLADPELSPFFKDVPIEKLHKMQHAFFSAALGGDIEYPGRPLAHVHHGLGIKPRHLKLFIEHLRETLVGHKLSERDQQDIIDRINTYADEIVGGGGLDG
jgi:hemoglobin